MSARYAVYFAPPADHALWRAGCDWLGRDPATGASTDCEPQRAAPRRYGFHATLKPPFALREGASPAHLLAALARFAGERTAFDMPSLEVATLDRFIALRPVVDSATLRALADDAVRLLDEFRRPPTPAETARRLAPTLDAAQRANVERWGYPQVFDQWRFHMTLTDALPDAAQAEALRGQAMRHFAAALAPPLRCDGVALFVEDTPGADFRLERRFGFAS